MSAIWACKTCVRVWGQRQYLVYAVRATIVNVWGLAVNNLDQRPRRRQKSLHLRHHLDSVEELLAMMRFYRNSFLSPFLSHIRYDIIYVQNFFHMSIHVTTVVIRTCTCLDKDIKVTF